MDKHTPGPLICDVRVGCVAVYLGEQRNCLCEAGDWYVYYKPGKYELDPETGSHNWTVDPKDVADAQFLTLAWNSHDDLLETLKDAVAVLDVREADMFGKLETSLIRLRTSLAAAIRKVRKAEEALWVQE